MIGLKMTPDEALALADQWCAGLTMDADSKGWGAILLVLAEEVRRLREREAGLLEQHSRDSAELRRVCAERDEARADERTAMSYLAAVRQVVGGEDFPDMVRRVEGLRADAERLDRLDAQRGDNVQRNQYGEPELVAHYWAVEGQCHDVRTAIDNTMEASNAG